MEKIEGKGKASRREAKEGVRAIGDGAMAEVTVYTNIKCKRF